MRGSYERFRSSVGVGPCSLGPFGQRALLELALACGSASPLRPGEDSSGGVAADLRWQLVQNSLGMVVMQQAVADRSWSIARGQNA